jgi:hypothetical protein
MTSDSLEAGWPKSLGSALDKSKILISFTQLPSRLWDPPSVLSNRRPRALSQGQSCAGHEAGHSPPSRLIIHC